MALAISASRRRRAGRDDPFALYVVDSDGPPLIHVSRTRRSEIVVFGRQQKLLPPIVLDTGTIFLNAAENDDKIELSKIIPNRFGDADTKITTTLELAEVVRKTASLGATYPQIVAILETAKRQKNLPGELVVDAVPVSNRAYLEAVMGKDATAKRDDALKRTSGETSRPGRRWLLGIFGRNTDQPAKNHPADRSSKDASTASAQGTASSTNPSNAPNRNLAPDLNHDDNAKKGDGAADELPAKKDDAVHKAKVEESAPPRWRLFDVFRRNDES
jgi:hypothetical protein